VLVSGKGGCGKTTIAALLSIILSRRGYNVLALDTDSVPNLAQSLGVPYEVASKIVPLVKNEEFIEERTGARPGEGWGVLFSLTPHVEDIAERYGVKISDNLRLVVVGSIDVSKEGCMCPAIALARLFLLHVLLRSKDVVIVDSEAGAEVFGRGLAEKFDLNICVAEPTMKSLAIAKKLVKLAKQLGVGRNVIVVNKVTDVVLAYQLFNRVFTDLRNSVEMYVVRFDENVIKLENAGEGLQKLDPCSVIYRDVKKLADRVEKMMRLRATSYSKHTFFETPSNRG